MPGYIKRISIIVGITFLLIFLTNACYFEKLTKKGRSFELGEIKVVHSKVTNQDYELIINYPYSYGEDTLKRYPVVYFCDGYYDFPLLAMIYANQAYDKTINECILVGFSYKGENLDYRKLRLYDYTPTEIKEAGHTGGAPIFLKVIETDFIPYIEKNYPIDTSFRALGGSSLAGLFTLYAMFTQPDLFNAYIAVSPAVVWDNGWLFKLEKGYHNQHTALPISLYMTGAEKEFADRPEFLNCIKRFDTVLKKHNYRNFRYQFRIIDDAYHAGSKPEGYSRGMQFIFAPLLEKQVK